MITQYFHDQLEILRDDAVSFADSYPAIASFLNAKKTDPDVERLSEAVAYLIGMISLKTNLDLPVLNHILANLLLPQLMRAIPASTLIEFTSSEGKTVTIPEGVLLKSLPVIDGMQCLFSTTCELDIQPVEITDAGFTPKGAGGEIWLKMALKGGLRLSEWSPEKLTLFLTDDNPAASEIYYLLSRNLKSIKFSPSVGGAAVTLHPSCLTAAGFSESDAALPLYPAHAFPGYRIIQEFFHMPGKFLAFHLTGFEEWENRGQWIEFTICFELDTLSSPPPRISRKSFAINAVPAVNIFPHPADPISLNHHKSRSLIRPSGPNPAGYQIYSIDSVVGFSRKSMRERDYLPFEMFDGNADEPHYQAMPEKSLLHDGYDYHLSVAFSEEEPFPDSETLSIELQCTNGSLPENLRIGDISIPVFPLPESISFKNITSITPYIAPPSGPELQQRLITALSLNQKPISTLENLQTLLKMYLFPGDNPSDAQFAANMKRISSIEAFEVTPGEQMVAGILMRGSEIRMKMRQDHFAGAGDFCLFSSVLDCFFGVSSAINSYTRLTVYETTRGVTYNWPIRIGNCNNDGLAFKSDLPKRKYQQNIRQNEKTSRTDKNSGTGTLLDDLLTNGHQYSYYQAMRVARRVFGPGGKEHIPGIPWQKRVHIRPDLSFAFPAADIKQIEKIGKDIRITVTFMAIYGSSTPLPNFYTEDLMLEEAEDSSVSRDLIDILHQKIYHLLFKAWSKHRLYIRAVEDKDTNTQTLLDCLIGYGEKEQRESQPGYQALLPYTAIISQNPRSALGLQTILRHAFGINCIEIEQCVERKTPIPDDQRMRLGVSGMRLGIDTFIGSHVTERMGKFRIHIGPLTRKEFNNFLPEQPGYIKLKWLMQRLMRDPLECDLNLIIGIGEAKPIRLGDPDSPRLGWGSWLLYAPNTTPLSAIFPLSKAITGQQLPEEATTLINSVNSLDSSNSLNSEPSTLIEHYQQQMAGLNDLATRYVQFHPNLAPMMGGKSADTGIQRLFQLVAFLIANLQLKLNDDFPELIHDVTEALQPNQLRPVPATTIVAFTPKPEHKQPQLIPAGAEVSSVPVKGIECKFRTCFDITVHPLTLIDAAFIHPPGRPRIIKLLFELNGMTLSTWEPKSLRFFLGDDYPAACTLYLLLMRYLTQIVITSPENGATIVIPADCLKPVGFAANESILSNDDNIFPGHLVLQEYFLFPDKYLFFDLTGLERLSDLGKGSRFEISFELANTTLKVPPISEKSFVPHAVPVINLFAHKAKPIIITANEQRHKVTPVGKKPDHYCVYSVDLVAEFEMEDAEEKTYRRQSTLSRDSEENPLYNIAQSKSLHREGFDTFISILHQIDNTQPSKIKLNIDLTCTNGSLPEQLNIGDICNGSADTPDFVNLKNIKCLTPDISPDIEQNRLWRLLSGFSLNSGSLHIADNLRAIIRLYINSNSRNQIAVAANIKRVDAIVSIDAKPINRLVNRSMYRGYDIRLKLRGDHFDGPGDMYMFSSILERFLGGYVTKNCFIRLVVEEISEGCRFEWPARLGDRGFL